MSLRRCQYVAIGLLACVAACSSDDDGPTPERFNAALTQDNERPLKVVGTATGTATFSSNGTTVNFTLDVNGLTGVTQAHIHLGGSAVAGPILVGLYSNSAGTGAVNGQLTSGSFQASDIQLGVSLDSLLALLRAGNAYVNVHTQTNASGAMRGQVIPPGAPPPPERFFATLNGANERPNPNPSTATGTSAMEVDGNKIKFTINVVGITDATLAHIHNGAATAAAGVVVPLFSNSAGTGPLTGNLISGTFEASNINNANISLDSLLVLLRTGNAYVNVHTKAFPGGEIRGQTAGATIVTIP